MATSYVLLGPHRYHLAPGRLRHAICPALANHCKLHLIKAADLIAKSSAHVEASTARTTWDTIATSRRCSGSLGRRATLPGQVRCHPPPAWPPSLGCGIQKDSIHGARSTLQHTMSGGYQKNETELSSCPASASLHSEKEMLLILWPNLTSWQLQRFLQKLAISFLFEKWALGEGHSTSGTRISDSPNLRKVHDVVQYHMQFQSAEKQIALPCFMTSCSLLANGVKEKLHSSA